MSGNIRPKTANGCFPGLGKQVVPKIETDPDQVVLLRLKVLLEP